MKRNDPAADLTSLLSHLNPAQRRAATALQGPVVILAGAGTGKTTTITHRIACQVAAGVFEPQAILAVTFTQKAAGELRQRLFELGVEGVEARTFHSAALAQLSGLWERHTGTPLPKILDHKAPVIASLANALPPPHKFLPRRDLASEVEWAKNRRITVEHYLTTLAQENHEPPIPPDLMYRIYDGYERRKSSMGKLDFEDMLELAIRLFDEHPEAANTVRARFASFTVDEFQDVNPLQASLLDRWLGGRDELCVVGDDYQTIYAFTGASPSHLLGFPKNFPNATLVTLEDNYRSSPHILEAANNLAAHLGGFEKQLRSTQPEGPEPTVRAFVDEGAEVEGVLSEVRRLHGEGVSWEQMAVLYRINARSEPYEEALARSGIPYQVRDGAFLRRPGPRGVIARLRSESQGAALGEAVDRATDAMGYDPETTPDSAEEAAMSADLLRMRELAREYASAADAQPSIPGFLAELDSRFAVAETGRGIQLMTYHRAKGLEFDAVFLPRVADGELPFRSGRSFADPDEERRLFYVGITRARRWLHVSWSKERRTGRSPFVSEAFPRAQRNQGSDAGPRSRPDRTAAPTDEPTLAQLKAWRSQRAKADGVPAYVVFHDSTLEAMAEAGPRTDQDLLAIKGVGPAKLERYGADLLAIFGEPGV